MARKRKPTTPPPPEDTDEAARNRRSREVWEAARDRWHRMQAENPERFGPSKRKPRRGVSVSFSVDGEGKAEIVETPEQMRDRHRRQRDLLRLLGIDPDRERGPPGVG